MRGILLAVLLLSGLGASAEAVAQQCVPYARQISGLSLRGDAWQWWAAAEGAYQRGSRPQAGAVLVFKKTAKMRHGHVAVVSRVVGSREIRVDHANWETTGRGRGRVTRDVPVIDVSPRNDWTAVRVWHEASRSYGRRVNPTYGFIYGGRAGGQGLSNVSTEPRGLSADELNRRVLDRLARAQQR